MYHTNELHSKPRKTGEGVLPQEEKEKFFSMDTLLNLSETIATMLIGGGFLLLVATCLSTL